jgi:hypothetical protein
MVTSILGFRTKVGFTPASRAITTRLSHVLSGFLELALHCHGTNFGTPHVGSHSANNALIASTKIVIRARNFATSPTS